MHKKHRWRPVGSNITLVVTCMLVLAACGSSSVSGTEPSGSKGTNAEAKAPSSPNSPSSRGIIDAVISQIR